MSEEKERERFESWAVSQNWVCDKDSFGDYVFEGTRDGWSAWRAARADFLLEVQEGSIGDEDEFLHLLMKWDLADPGHKSQRAGRELIAYIDSWAARRMEVMPNKEK